MRHQKNTRKFGRTSQHRDLMLANLVASLIIHKRIKTTLAKAKAVRPLAEKLVTLGKSGTLHDRRLAIAKIGQKDAVATLFKSIAPSFKDRKGGYTRIIKLGPRDSDSAKIALIEWVDFVVEDEQAPAATATTTAAAKAEKPVKAEAAEKSDKPAKAEKAEKAEKPKKETKADKE